MDKTLKNILDDQIKLIEILAREQKRQSALLDSIQDDLNDLMKITTTDDTVETTTDDMIMVKRKYLSL